VPLMQRAPSDKSPIETDGSLYAGAIVLQTSHPMNDMEALVRQTLSAINPNLTVVKFQTFDDQISDIFTEDRLLARLTMLFGALALLLATVGLYGVTAYTVARRTSEIGIRMALGARRAQVVRLVCGQNALVAIMGTAAGFVAALLASRALASFLYGTSVRDPWVLAGSVLALALIASAASLLPALRAARIDPMAAIRCE
jgi:macrolide transport system ATP-binding/permease protein